MGCSMSVYFANTFMAHRMRHLLENPPPDLLYLGRYIDDIIGIWANNNTTAITATFNPLTDEHIGLTWVFGGGNLEALDVKIHLEDGTITTILFLENQRTEVNSSIGSLTTPSP